METTPNALQQENKRDYEGFIGYERPCDDGKSVTGASDRAPLVFLASLDAGVENIKRHRNESKRSEMRQGEGTGGSGENGRKMTINV